jgi:very-short-patch-repair endonuclease
MSDAELARLAARQRGLFTSEHARRTGLDRSALHRRMRNGVVERVEPRIWRFTAVPVTWEQRVLASCWAESGDASHRTAGALWTLDGCHPGVIEVLTQRWRRRPNASVRIHETTSLHDDDRTIIEGIPVTSPSRTIVDLSAVVPERRVEQALDSVWQRKLATPEELWACIERLDSAGRPWVVTPKRLVARRLGIDLGPNLFEERLFSLLHAARLPLPEAQVPISAPDGAFVARPDWLFPDLLLVLECDSFRWHGAWHRRKADLRRDRRLVALGYTVLRISWEDLDDHAEQVVQDVRDAIHRLAA